LGGSITFLHYSVAKKYFERITPSIAAYTEPYFSPHLLAIVRKI